MLALALSWVGDLCLLSASKTPFLVGIGAFLFAHIAFAVAFSRQPSATETLWVTLPLLALLGAFVLRWLWPHLRGFFRGAVVAYVAAIVAMAALAIGASLGGSHWTLAVGALMFAVSDVSVARDRFVREAIVNRVWGLPLYYGAQVLLAWSCATVLASG